MKDQMNILIDKAVFGSRRGSKCLRFFIIDRLQRLEAPNPLRTKTRRKICGAKAGEE